MVGVQLGGKVSNMAVDSQGGDWGDGVRQYVEKGEHNK